MPYHAKKIYQIVFSTSYPPMPGRSTKEAFNSAWEQYKDKADRRDDASREETAHKVAWAAVKKEYAKGEDDKWHKKT